MVDTRFMSLAGWSGFDHEPGSVSALSGFLFPCFLSHKHSIKLIDHNIVELLVNFKIEFIA